jgi:hypothetical protein
MFFSSQHNYKKKFQVLCQGTIQWRRNSRWRLDTNHELSQFQCKSIEILGFERTNKLKNIVQVTFFFQNFKMEDKFKMAASITILYFVLYLSQFFTVFKK